VVSLEKKLDIFKIVMKMKMALLFKITITISCCLYKQLALKIIIKTPNWSRVCDLIMFAY